MKGLILSALMALSTSQSTNLDLSTNLGPSARHSNLGIDLPTVQRRTLKRDSIPYSPDDLNFTHGIASGDPYPTSVILWTRVAPSLASDLSNTIVKGNVPLYPLETEKCINADPNPICVDWAVWLATPSDNTVVASGKAYTTSDIHFTIEVEASGLSPFTEYNYQFPIVDRTRRVQLGRPRPRQIRGTT